MPDRDAYAKVLLGSLTITQRRRLESVVGLDEVIAGWLRRGQHAHPGLQLSPEAFVRFVAQRWPVADGEVPDVRAEDLYLACACVQGDVEALRIFERMYLARLDSALRSIVRSSAVVEDVRAELRSRLLVASPEAAPKLADYAGRGDLWSWIRISAIRAALRRNERSRREHAVEQSVLDALAPAEDVAPDLDAGHPQLRGALRGALEQAMTGLRPRDKTLLLQHYIDGLTTEELGRLHRVHRVTISRRLVKARRTLLSQTRRGLMQQLALSPSECDSVIRLVRSQLDLTLSRVLAQPDAAD